MALLSSTEQLSIEHGGEVTRSWSPRARQQLCQLAVQAIQVAAREHHPMFLDINDIEPELRRPGASFVTLHRQENLRGCIGSLEPHQPLALDVISNACGACCRDMRFSVVMEEELAGLNVDVAVLSTLMPMPVSTQEQLSDLLRPGIDGLVIDDGVHRATFLPAVWLQLPDKAEFIAELKRKAGLDKKYWSPAIHCFRYAVDEFHIESLR